MVSDNQCICRACEIDFKHNKGKDGYRFRWMHDSGNQAGPNRCIVASCTETSSIIHTTIATKDKIAHLLHEQVLSHTQNLVPTLCPMHYREVHRLLHSGDTMYTEKRCSTCNVCIRGILRHCPNIKVVRQYFSQTGDTDLSLTDQDYICTMCYNSQLLIVRDTQTNSTDSELEERLHSEELPALWDKSYPSHFAVALKETISKLGDVLKKKLAILFPDVYRCFIALVKRQITGQICESDISKNFPKKYLFACITSFFDKHIVCECKQRHHGRLLYRRGTDLGEVLSKTLHSIGGSGLTLLDVMPERDHDSEIVSFCDLLNNKVHQQIKAITEQDAKTPYDISSFDLQSCIDRIDPILWKAIVLITQSVREKKHRSSETENLSHRRKLQCLYTLCVILFNTNHNCSVPLHLLLTDLVESQGGSSELIRLLNSVGAIASMDTHQRHVQLCVEKKCKRGILSELDMNNFTIVSIDNIDFLQRHAYVYCGDQSRRHISTYNP